MLVLFETPVGYSLFKVSDEKWKETEDVDMYEEFFSSSEKATSFLNLKSFQQFSDTADAVSAATACVEGKVSPSLQQFLKRQLGTSTKSKKSKKNKRESSSSLGESTLLAVEDAGLVKHLKESMPHVQFISDTKTLQLFRGIRSHMDELLTGDNDDNNNDTSSSSSGVSASTIRAMQLGLSHSLSRYKLKFSSDKVDTMIIQAVGLLDELDKEINTYAMRVKEWYGWHFPEMQKIVNDNAQYSKVVLASGFRTNIREKDLSSILEDETIEATLKESAEVSMGTEISDLDIIHIQSLAEQVVSLTDYRAQLFEYLRNRMNAIAPNLTILVGELVGARLISHAGSLMNLAKQPASTVQILGAEKALFRALKTKHDTPKYGLIYHASLVGQAAPKHKGKISRVLAAKAALATRVDALTDDTDEGGGVDTTIGFEGRAKVEARLRQLEGGSGAVIMSSVNRGGMLTAAKTAKYSPAAARSASGLTNYNESNDMVLEKEEEDNETKNDDDDNDEKEEAEVKVKKEKKKKKKKDKKRKADDDDAGEEEKEKKKKKKRKTDDDDDDDDAAAAKAAKKAAKKAKKEKRKSKD